MADVLWVDVFVFIASPHANVCVLRAFYSVQLGNAFDVELQIEVT